MINYYQIVQDGQDLCVWHFPPGIIWFPEVFKCHLVRQVSYYWDLHAPSLGMLRSRWFHTVHTFCGFLGRTNMMGVGELSLSQLCSWHQEVTRSMIHWTENWDPSLVWGRSVDSACLASYDSGRDTSLWFSRLSVSWGPVERKLLRVMCGGYYGWVWPCGSLSPALWDQ